MYTNNCLFIEHRYEELATFFDLTKGGKQYTFQNFKRTVILIKKQLVLKIVCFPTKQDKIFDYNPQYFMYGNLMFDDIIMNLLINTKEKLEISEISFAK